MAETLGVPFIEIMKAAIIPAVLYFGACYWAVHLEAGKLGLHGLQRSELPSAWAEIRDNWFLLLPLVALVALLFGGFTPLFAGAVGLALTVVFILGTAIVLGVGVPALRILFWLGLGLVTAYSLWLSVTLVVGVVFVLVAVSLVTSGGRATLMECRNALADGARQALPVGLACVTVGILIGMMTLTGVGTIIGNAMIGIGRDSLFVALLLTMVFNLVLGIGLPTVPNYIITSSLAAPILLQLGVPLIVSHMFVFYFGIMADLSPPVALAAYAAAPMAKVSGMKIGWEAMRIALPGFVWPFLAVYSPQLMLQPVAGLEGAEYWLAVAFVVAKAALTIILWGVAAFGYLFGRLAWWERLLAATAAILLVVTLPMGAEIGFALSAAVFGINWWRWRSVTAPARLT
jgi:TRAP transporter 4TM/12TM fusion protein